MGLSALTPPDSTIASLPRGTATRYPLAAIARPTVVEVRLLSLPPGHPSMRRVASAAFGVRGDGTCAARGFATRC